MDIVCKFSAQNGHFEILDTEGFDYFVVFYYYFHHPTINFELQCSFKINYLGI